MIVVTVGNVIQRKSFFFSLSMCDQYLINYFNCLFNFISNVTTVVAINEFWIDGARKNRNESIKSKLYNYELK